MSEEVTIAVDAMGGDDAPGVVLDGVAQALEADGALHVVLCGPAEVVEPFAAAHERCVARVTTEVIGMGEHPAEAVRKKKDSSVVVGCRLVREGAAQGFFSAGSTGACLAAGTLVMAASRAWRARRWPRSSRRPCARWSCATWARTRTASLRTSCSSPRWPPSTPSASSASRTRARRC